MFFFQAEDGIRDVERSRGLGDVYKRQEVKHAVCSADKARKYLGYQTTVKLDDSIQKVINYIKSKGPKKFTYNYKLEINNEKTPDTWKKKVF